MPIHDWSRVSAGIFHHFHTHWISSISHHLNAGGLPSEYYALAEQFAGDVGRDIFSLEQAGDWNALGPSAGQGTLAVALHPPKVSVTASIESGYYIQKQQTLVIRHTSGDKIVALVEIISPGNKASHVAMQKLLDKAAAALDQGYHLLIVDLQRPTVRDPNGIHGAIWSAIGNDDYRAPQAKPLTLAAYSAGPCTTAYVEPMAVGEDLPQMPLFLDSSMYVNVPLEATYMTAWESVPQRWKSELAPHLA